MLAKSVFICFTFASNNGSAMAAPLRNNNNHHVRKRSVQASISFLLVILICILMFSCENPNPFAPDKPSYQPGISFLEDKIPMQNEEYVYRQGICVNYPNGVLYAYRISTLSTDFPDNIVTDDDGWVYFRSPGDDGHTPLVEPGTHRTIWTNQSRLNLDFASTGNTLRNMVVKVDVQVKAGDGSIKYLTSPFKSDRLFGSRIYAKFNSGSTVGLGLMFRLEEIIGDIYVDGMYAHHFMYRLNTLDSDMNVISFGAWQSSINCRDIREVVLNTTSTPALIVSPQNTWLQFESYVVSRQGVEESTPETIYFRTAQGNRPVAKIYSQALVGLGQFHYTLDVDSNVAAYYEQIPSSSIMRNRQLWNNEGGLCAVNSQDFKLHLRWGYSGEYSADNPFHTAMNICLNEQGQSYYSSITAYDLRLDGAPYPSNSGFVDPVVVTHNDGSSWLRVHNILDSCRHGVLSNLTNGTHVFQVCAVDLQGVYSAPAEQSFTLLAFKPVSQRTGILLVDDSPSHNTYSPELTVDNIYNEIIPSTWGAVDTYDIVETGSLALPLGTCMLMNYKAVLWHADNLNSQANLSPNVDALDCYLANGGNLCLSSTNKLYTTISELAMSHSTFVSERLGINNSNCCGYLGVSITTNPFFVQANGLDGLGNIAVETDNSFCSLVNTRKGLSIITYFNPDSGLDFMYSLGCKPVNFPNYPPTQEQYNQYSAKYVAYKYSHSGSNVVVFGFPLSYMDQADLSGAMQNIMGGILGKGSTKGGAK